MIADPHSLKRTAPIAPGPIINIRDGGITARYKRATAALDERARARLWGRSGSESSASSSEADSAELADLVDSFYDAAAERGGSGDDEIIEPEWDSETNCGGRVGRDSTRALEAALGESEDDSVADRIRVEVERAIKLVGSSSDGFRRRVVTRLRNKGFNAGVCKSSWERSGSLPAGSHEYIDVITRDDGTARYIVEINIAAEFEIARPSTAYLKLLQPLPAVLVAKPEHLKEVVRVMCAAATESIKSAGMHVPRGEGRSTCSRSGSAPIQERPPETRRRKMRDIAEEDERRPNGPEFRRTGDSVEWTLGGAQT
uniref:DUF506 family protein n=1 Tax=Ananas comosus var. bracteatus TaxID=296719 RepID=A0A6V7QRY7_ANACO